MTIDPATESASASASASPSSTAPLPDVSELDYEAARDALVEVVTRLEQGSLTLDDSISLWERGEALAARCEEQLLGARARLERAKRGADESADEESASRTAGSAEAGARA